MTNNTLGASAVRERTPEDIPACARALKDVHQLDGYPVEGVADAEGWLFPPGLLHAWVAGRSDDIVGHVAICSPRGEAAVSMLVERTGLSEDGIAVMARLFVVPAARGRKLGQSLAIAAMRYAWKHHRRVVFDVMTKDETAIRLYERLGCERLGTTMHEFGEDQQVPAYCYVVPDFLAERAATELTR